VGAAGDPARQREENDMRAWRKPKIVEKACGCEVSTYADAEI
jgi:hypothetical protein